MFRIKFIIISIIVFLFILERSFANDFARNETIGMLGNLKSTIIETVNEKEKSIIKGIDIKVPDNPCPSMVVAVIKDDKRYVLISTGFSVVTRMIITAFVMEREFKLENFGYEYTKYCAQTYQSESFDAGKPPWELTNLSEYDLNKIKNDKYLGSLVQSYHNITLMYALSHEIGHHVLNHDFGEDISLEKSRAQEKEADFWAIKTLISIGVPPSLAFTSLIYWYCLDKKSVKIEYRKSHPSDLRRIRWMIKETIKRADEWNSKYVKEKFSFYPYLNKTQLEKTIRGFNSALNFVEDLMVVQTRQYKLCLETMYEITYDKCKKYNSHEDCIKKIKSLEERFNKAWSYRCKKMLRKTSLKSVEWKKSK